MINEFSAWEIRDKIDTGGLSACEAAKATLSAIAQTDKHLHAYNAIFADRAMEQAHSIDKAKAAGRSQGLLAGVPIAIKDNLCTTFGATTCCSKMLENFHSPYDATVVKKLQEAGAVILGKTNLDEFAMGSSTENSAFGPTRNPWNTKCVPGGSSGGSAAATAARLCAAALGSDTGGSIRQPASLCGIVGLKPTYGLVSRYGLVAFASSLDQIGPMTRTVRDAALLLQVIAGHDPLDSTSWPEPVPDYLSELDRPLHGVRIGLPAEFSGEGIEPEVSAAVAKAVDFYRSQGAAVVDVNLPHTKYGIAAYYIIAPAEASSNLSRYDGVHYGHRTAKPEDLFDLYAASRAEGFGPEVQRRIMLGTYALSSGYYDAYYLRAQKVRALMLRDFNEAFASVDAILTPTAPSAAFAIGEKMDDPVTMYLNDVFTVPSNLAGVPAMSVPAGLDARGLPLGLQVIGRHFDEETVFAVAGALERAAGFTARPAVRAGGTS